MGEQYLIFSSQIAVLTVMATLASLYACVALVGLLAHGYTKLRELFHTAIRRADDLGTNVAHMRPKNSNTKIVGV